MGYYAKDGSYVRDDSDIRFAEVMNESQGQAFDREQRVTAQAEAYEAEEKRRKEAERQYGADLKYQMFINRNREAAETKERIAEERKQENERRYGVSFSLRNPQSLDERKSRANFWRLNNNFTFFLGVVTGKELRFGKLWDKYNAAKTDEERRQIVEKMEKMYPTRESAIRAVERKTGYRR